MKIYHWNKHWEECQLEFYGQDFVAIDPGATGCAITFVAGKLAAFYSLKEERDVSQLREDVSDLGIKLVVIEDQFFLRNPDALIKLAFSAGVVVGALAPDAVVKVQPKVWQSLIIPGVRNRTQCKLAAELTGHSILRGFNVKPPGWTKDKLEGFWDALCIGEWWLSSSEPEAEERAE